MADTNSTLSSSTPATTFSTTTVATNTATLTATRPWGFSPSPSIDSSSSSVLSGEAGVPIQTVFYFIAFLILMVAVFYTVHVVRRERRRRRREREGTDPEANRTRYTSTYRPETDEACPPQYRSHMLDEPFYDNQTVYISPDQQVHYGPEAQRLTTNMGEIDGYDDPSCRPDTAPGMANTANTTTTPTTPITTPAPSRPSLFSRLRSITAPNANNVPIPSSSVSSPNPGAATSGSEEPLSALPQGTDTPVISAPSPAFTFSPARHFSIMRMGLGGSNNIHQSGVRSPSSGSSSSQNDSGNSNSEQTISSEQTSISGTPESSLPTSPVSSRPTSMLVDRASSLGSLGNEMSERHRSPGMMHPVLYRLRSQGPPPYAPLAPEQTASQLPPEYTTTVEISRL